MWGVIRFSGEKDCAVMKRFGRLTFATKLIIVYICSLFFVICMVTVNQIHAAAAVLEQESAQNLQMLTEQIALNFRENQQSLGYTIYSRMAALEIPTLMDEYSQGLANTTLADVRYALAQMITESTDYDYILLELSDSTRVNASGVEIADPRTIRENCDTILDEHRMVTYGNSNWYRGTDGGVYILRDVYAISPLRRVGKAVIHMRGNIFSVSYVYEDTGFLFYDIHGNYLSGAGMEVPEEVRDTVTGHLTDQALYQGGSWLKQDYYMAASTSGSWITVGVSSTSAYRRMVSHLVQNGILFGCIGMFLGGALLLFLIQSLVSNLTELQKAMTRVANGDFSQHIPVSGNDDISQLAETMNHMTSQIQELLEQLVEKERLKNEAEIEILEYKYRSLETQIRPHFIYNALETINSMAKLQGNLEIVEIVQRISRYFRSITVNTTRQFITCQQEFDMLQDYTEIYRFIHGDKLKTTFSAKEEARNALIPTMILQPVVENALQHGIRGQDADSEIIVHAYVRENRLNLTVKDTGYGLSPQMEQKLQSGQIETNRRGGIGLGNVRQRLQLIYGEDAMFTISNRDEGGVVVKITIPLTYIEPEILGGDDLDWDLGS